MSSETPAARTAAVGTNVRGSAAGAAWTYLLDSLELDEVVCVGEPSPAASATLERVAKRVRVATTSELAALEPASVDLVYITDAADRSIGHDALAAIARALRPGGELYLEARGRGTLESSLAAAGLERVDRFWLTPARGEARSAVPADEAAIRRYFVRHRIGVPSLPRGLRVLDRLAPELASRHRTGLLARHADVSKGGSVPAYIVEIAAAAGVDLRRHRIGLSARGRYSSRKVILFLFGPGAARPEIVVKTTRDPVHNARLENEERILRRIADDALMPTGSAPSVEFAGEHGGLHIVGESALHGRIVASRPDPADEAAAYRWLTDLAANSARRGGETAAAIEKIVEDTSAAAERIYALTPRERDRLRASAAALVDAADRVPTVLMHGDATSLNALRLAGGRIAFLDWEAATPDGLPLWDTFHFARSYAIRRARLRSIAKRPERMLDALERNETLARAVGASLERIGLDGGLVGPLFELGWAHRAVRESSRLSAEALDRGDYVSLLRASLGRPPLSGGGRRR
jgi:SAM-dependent methyltransferase